jgi:hypothetical protein
MTHYWSNFDLIERDFLNKKIPIHAPGFYNHKNFIKEEKENPEYLSNYARYVQKKNYDETYIEKAKKEIPIICNAIYEELVKDGRKGACVDVAQALSKILEREGYWNYMVKGALTISFPTSTGISTKHFWPFDPTNPHRVGHVWIAAPPFNVIDVTVRMQPYSQGEEHYLPSMVIEENITDCTIETKDIFSPEAILMYSSQRIPIEKMIHLITPNVERFMSVFNPNKVNYEGTELKYIPVAASASDGELYEMKCLCLNGRYAHAIYEEVVKPQLEKIR